MGPRAGNAASIRTTACGAHRYMLINFLGQFQVPHDARTRRTTRTRTRQPNLTYFLYKYFMSIIPIKYTHPCTHSPVNFLTMLFMVSDHVDHRICTNAGRNGCCCDLDEQDSRTAVYTFAYHLSSQCHTNLMSLKSSIYAAALITTRSGSWKSTSHHTSS